MKIKNLIGIIVIVAIVSLITYGIVISETTPGEYDDFAKCLTNKGIVMYGTDWCHNCQDQKALFGKSFKYIIYKNCDWDRKDCSDAGIERYPTWIVNKTKYLGMRFLKELSTLSGCSL